ASATPAASASLTKLMSRLRPSSKNFSASKSTHSLAMLAAERVLPRLTIAGNATPSGSCDSAASRLSSTSRTVSRTSAGRAPIGVGMRTRSESSVPCSRLTIPALMPVPPISTPIACCAMPISLSRSSDPIRIVTDPDEGADMCDGDEKYWFNLSSREVEFGMQSAAVDRVGPFDTAEEAANAPEKLRERSRAWADDDAAEDSWGTTSLSDAGDDEEE